MTTQYDKQKAQHTYETLRANPQIQAEKVRAHYRRIGGMFLSCEWDDYSQDEKRQVLEQIQAEHLEDFGIELEWEFFKRISPRE